VKPKRTTFGSDEHRQAIQLRNEFLRKPLGLPLLKDFPAEEKDWLHYVMLNEQDHVVGCLVAIIKSKASARLRQMAVHESFQRQGVGKALLAFAEKDLRQTGIREIIIHARKHAAGFYQKNGYTQEGKEFLEVSIPHFAMIKSLPE
jgi:N-acetylglutamate synthase-like GNAT family acetyltransferase